MISLRGPEAVLPGSLLLLIVSAPTILGIKVADILESEKVTPASILQNKRVTVAGGVRVADILEMGKVTPPSFPSILQNRNAMAEGREDEVATENDGGPLGKTGLHKKYPLITMPEDYNKDVPPKPKAGKQRAFRPCSILAWTKNVPKFNEFF